MLTMICLTIAGLLVLGRTHLYLMDGLLKLASGEIVASQLAPQDAFTIPSGTIAELDAEEMQSHSW